MERLYYSTKWYLSNFHLYNCCWLLPVRIGLFLIGYINVAVDIVYLGGIAGDNIEPTILSVQNELLGNVSKPIPMTAYATEMGFNIVLLCGLHHNDLFLVQIFFYYTIFAVALSFMTYSLVMAAISLNYKLAIIFSTIFQMYCILLVRSEIVNMKMKRKRDVLYNLMIDSVTPPDSPYMYPKNKLGGNLIVTEISELADIQIKLNIDERNERLNKDGKKLEEVCSKEEKKKEEQILKEERRKEEQRIKEQKKQEELRIKDEKKIQEQMMKEAKKRQEQRIKEEKRQEKLRIKEEKRQNERRIKKEMKHNVKRITEEEKLEKIREEKQRERNKCKDHNENENTITKSDDEK